MRYCQPHPVHPSLYPFLLQPVTSPFSTLQFVSLDRSPFQILLPTLPAIPLPSVKCFPFHAGHPLLFYVSLVAFYRLSFPPRLQFTPAGLALPAVLLLHPDDALLCCLLSAACCLPSAVCCLLSVVRCLLSAVGRLLSAVGCLLLSSNSPEGTLTILKFPLVYWLPSPVQSLAVTSAYPHC